MGVDGESGLMVEVVRIPALSDNYIWMLHDPGSGETIVVDPSLGAPVLAEAASRGWRISQIWNTHWHPDHTGGNQEIKAATGCLVTAPASEAARIPTLDRAVGEGDRVKFGPLEAEVMEVPAHTAGHIAFHLESERMLFPGDTLFAMGCGRLFEGNAGQMHSNLQRLSRLAPETLVYCAHEYTLANGVFALTVEPHNPDLASRVAEVRTTRERGEATIPTTIGLERATNPFMRAGSVEELAERRLAKDIFQ